MKYIFEMDESAIMDADVAKSYTEWLNKASDILIDNEHSGSVVVPSGWHLAAVIDNLGVPYYAPISMPEKRETVYERSGGSDTRLLVLGLLLGISAAVGTLSLLFQVLQQL